MTHFKPYFDHSQDHKIAPAVLQNLTPREKDVVIALCKGYLERSEISGVLGLSEHTVSDNFKVIYKKLSIRSKKELLRRCYADISDEEINVKVSAFFAPYKSTAQQVECLHRCFGGVNIQKVADESGIPFTTLVERAKRLSSSFRETANDADKDVLGKDGKLDKLKVLYHILELCRDERERAPTQTLSFQPIVHPESTHIPV